MIFWHIYFNWKPIKNYLKVKKKLKIFTKEFNVALIVTSLFVIGTATMIPPFSFLVNFGNGMKAKNSLQDGNPPFGYAEYSTLKDFTLLMDINLSKALNKLKNAKVIINSDKEILKTVALNNNKTPKEIYQIIKPKDLKIKLPSNIPIGIAKKSFKRLSSEYDLNLDRLKKHLKYYNILITDDMTFKRVAITNNLHPAQLYNMLQASQQ